MSAMPKRVPTALIAVLMITLPVLMLGTARAQQPGAGSVCVIAYDDANRNGVRDPGESALLDVNISLMTPANVLIANHVTALREPYCFDNLPPQQYMVGIDSPLYDPVDPAPVSFTLNPDERVTYEFGAIARPPAAAPDPSESILYIPLTLPVRIGMSALGALLTMAAFTGLGLVVYGLLLHRRFPPVEDLLPEWAGPPPWEQPEKLADVKTAVTGKPNSQAVIGDDVDDFDADFDDPLKYGRDR